MRVKYTEEKKEVLGSFSTLVITTDGLRLARTRTFSSFVLVSFKKLLSLPLGTLS